MNLQHAANKVGIPRKTLDDYWKQLKFAKKFNFNFNKHWEAGFGKVRQFNRIMKEKEAKQQSHVKLEDSD